MTQTYSTDIVIFGGGIAGLWLLNRFRNAGYQAMLLEKDALGAGQTIASQGIIHGGLKYALSGSISGATNAITSMPGRWRSCLNAEADVDLSGCKILSDHYYMWSDSGLRSKLKTFLGSKSLQGRVASVSPDEYPEFFKNARKSGKLYRLPDFVVDTPSLLETLRRPQERFILKIDPSKISFPTNSSAAHSQVQIDEDRFIDTRKIIFCAGEGNQELIDLAGLTTPRTQTRPLHMTFLKRSDLPPVFVHCIGDSFSLTPKLTLTSHRDSDGNSVWYLGGEIAESGVTRTEEQQVAAAKTLLTELFPWVDTSEAEWGSFIINRAEPQISDSFRPDDAFFIEERNVLVAWPTKLTLCPSLADMLVEHLQKHSFHPSAMSDSIEPDNSFSSPKLAPARWD